MSGTLPFLPPGAGIPENALPLATSGQLDGNLRLRAIAEIGTGQVASVLVSPAQLASQLGAGGAPVPAATVIGLGAQGAVFNAVSRSNADASTSYGYMSTQAGPALPYVCRGDLSFSGQLLNTTSLIRVWFLYGQSWQTVSIALQSAILAAQALLAAASGALAAALAKKGTFLQNMLLLAETTTVFKFGTASGAEVAQIGSPTGVAGAVDFLGCSASTISGNPFGTFLSMCMQGFARRENRQIEPIVNLCAAYPGTGLASLLPLTDPDWIARPNGSIDAWSAQNSMIALVQQFAVKYGIGIKWEGINLIEGCTTGAIGAYEPLLTELLADYDALGLVNADGSAFAPKLFLDQTPANANVSATPQQVADQLKFAADNPNVVYSLGSRADCGLQDYIHWDAYGIGKAAERWAYIQHMVHFKLGYVGPPTMAGIYVVPNGDGTSTLTIDFSEPVSGKLIPLTVDANLAVNPNGADASYGIRAKTVSNGAFLAHSNVGVTGSRFISKIAGVPAVGDSISNAIYGAVGVAGVAPVSGYAGVFTNLKKTLNQVGLIDPTQTVDVWAASQEVLLTSANFATPPVLTAITAINPSGSITATANSTTVEIVATLSATTTGSPGTITWSLSNTGGNFALVNGNQVQAVVGLPAGSFALTITATASTGQSLTETLTVVAS